MAYRHYVLGLLLMVYIHCMLSRMLPAFLVSVPTPGCQAVCAAGGSGAGSLAPAANGECHECKARQGKYAGYGHAAGWYNMREGSGMAQWQYGLLVGYGFALPFVLCSLAMARTMDRVDRRAVLAAATLVWSLACAAMGLADSFLPLLVCRAVLGAAECVVVPAALSLVTQHFSPRAHGIVGSVLSAGVCLGAGAAAFALPLSLQVGWRATCALVGAAGVALSVLVAATVSEPAPPAVGVPAIAAARNAGVARPAAVWVLAAAASLRLAAAYTVAAFLPLYYMRAQLPGFDAGRYATANAAIVSTCGLLSALAGGVAADRLGQKLVAAPVAIAAVAQVVAAACFVGVFRATTFAGSLCAYGAALLAGECWYGLTLVQIRATVPPEMHGETTALVLSVATLTSNLIPAVIGAADSAGLGHGNLGGIACWVVTCCILGAGGLLFLACWMLERGQADGAVPPDHLSRHLLQPHGTGAKAAATPEGGWRVPPHGAGTPRLDRQMSIAESIQRRASTQTFFCAPGQADVVVPVCAVDESPRSAGVRARSLPAIQW